jgi:hypothetical protein
MSNEIEFNDPELRQAFDAFLEEIEGHDFDDHTKRVLHMAFSNGWSSCLGRKFGPVMEICMMLLRIGQIGEHGQVGAGSLAEDFKIVMSRDVVQGFVDRAMAIVGNPELRSLAQAVELVDQSDPSGGEPQ